MGLLEVPGWLVVTGLPWSADWQSDRLLSTVSRRHRLQTVLLLLRLHARRCRQCWGWNWCWSLHGQDSSWFHAAVNVTHSSILMRNNNKNSATADRARCVKRPFKVTQGHLLLCQSTRHIYDFLLALNSYLTSIFNRFWDIMPSLHSSIPHLSSRWNWKKTVDTLWCQDAQNIGLSNRKLKYSRIMTDMKQNIDRTVI